MSGTLRDLVPPGLRPLLPPVFDRAKPDEPRATCDSCAMATKDESEDERNGFLPDAKCCTFHPTLPNFYVGGLLADENPEGEEGRRRVRTKIAERHGVTPFWIRPPRKTRVFMDATRLSSFGKSKKLLCPYFTADGRCSIWHHREAVCSTWYCKHDRGAAGRRFWMALKDWLIYMERKLSFWAGNEVDPSVKDDGLPRLRITLDDLEDRAPSDDEQRSMWGAWFGREEEFYRECHARVMGLDPQRFIQIVQDKDANMLLAQVADTHDGVTAPRLATHLVPARYLWRKQRDKGESVVTYSNFDAQFVSDALGRLIAEIREGESVDDFIARMRREKGYDVPRALMQKLQDFEVLVPPGHEKAKKIEPAGDDALPAATTK